MHLVFIKTAVLATLPLLPRLHAQLMQLEATQLVPPGECRKVQFDLARFIYAPASETCTETCNRNLMHTYFGSQDAKTEPWTHRVMTAAKIRLQSVLEDLQFNEACMVGFFLCILKQEARSLDLLGELAREKNCFCMVSLLMERLQPPIGNQTWFMDMHFRVNSCELIDVIQRLELSSWQIYNASVLEQVTCEEDNCWCDLNGTRVCEGTAEAKWSRFHQTLDVLASLFRAGQVLYCMGIACMYFNLGALL
ncbi:hypothetical protein BCR37DRAFT_15269 [Protomyces lactucae-debilis]|uniref:Uncharacterized protein n=1 Tax=Protomyces lactucae-debilis TaxID=2754530 RepID=A0A1Y2FV84_PROLT|nr:uncharacterized protein BCR37DRAFT_15269 [Protomyces lactucae-debilis]ORY87879.1 hypothetical protein BCR37DRAFT_15269 [Protomyces lactucae-debilis]